MGIEKNMLDANALVQSLSNSLSLKSLINKTSSFTLEYSFKSKNVSDID